MRNKHVRSLVLAAACVAIGLYLPFLTGQIPEIGSKLSPIHIPILLCGFLRGWPYALAAGFITPPLRSAAIYALLMEKTFTMAQFITGAFADAVPGIILHIVLIPPIALALRRARILEG